MCFWLCKYYHISGDNISSDFDLLMHAHMHARSHKAPCVFVPWHSHSNSLCLFSFCLILSVLPLSSVRDICCPFVKSGLCPARVFKVPPHHPTHHPTHPPWCEWVLINISRRVAEKSKVLQHVINCQKCVSYMLVTANSVCFYINN